jgi:hypothetical protein
MRLRALVRSPNTAMQSERPLYALTQLGTHHAWCCPSPLADGLCHVVDAKPLPSRCLLLCRGQLLLHLLNLSIQSWVGGDPDLSRC